MSTKITGAQAVLVASSFSLSGWRSGLRARSSSARPMTSATAARLVRMARKGSGRRVGPRYREPVGLVEQHRPLGPALQPHHAEKIADTDPEPVEGAVIRLAALARAVIDLDRLDRA